MRYDNNSKLWDENNDCEYIQSNEESVECKCSKLGLFMASLKKGIKCQNNEFLLDEKCMKECPKNTFKNIKKMSCEYNGNP